MCGIAGIVRLDGAAVNATPLEGMLDVIRHRGPNGHGVWAEGSVALGHVRLSVIDLSERAHQPMFTADRQGVLVYNGEVYNFPRLREELEREGATFDSHGDSAVVLEAIHRWGPEAAIPRFDGMFALAYVDRRDGSLWLARDRIGIKNLSLFEQNGELIFCSEIKGLLEHPRVPVRADRGEVAHYLLYGSQSWRASLFEGVRPLDRGTLIRVKAGVLSTHVFHEVLRDFDPARVTSGGSLAPEDVVRDLDRALIGSTRSHLVSDAPLATMCSGGVDSSLLTAIVKDERPDLEAFVADVGGAVNEWPQAEKVGRHLGVPVHRIETDRESYLRLWPETVWHRDLPNWHPSDPPMLAVTRACHDRGIKVLLTGEGSDEVFAGYDRYRGVYERLRKARRRSRFPWWNRKSKRRWKRWRELPHLAGPARDEPSLRFRMAAAVAPAQEFYRLAIREHLQPIEPPEDRALLANQLDDMRFHLGRILFRHDRIGMAASIEMRVPFLANDVVDFGLHLPRSFKYRDGCLKWAVRTLAEKRLPHDVVHAPKKGFAVSPHLYRGTLGLLDRGLVPELLRWTRDETRRALQIASSDDDGAFHLVSLEIWARIFLGGESPAQVTERLRAVDRAGAGADDA